MIKSLWCIRWLWLYLLLRQNVRAEWPSSNLSHIQLLGLFINIFNTSDSAISSHQPRAMFQSAIILSQKYNITIDGQYIGWQSAQTEGDVMNALSTTCLLMSNSNIVGIVGPELSRESHIIAPFAAKISIPVISYASTDPELSDRNAYSSFYRTVPSDNTAALAIVNLFLLFNWTSCIIIYQNDAFGIGGAKAITDTFNNNRLTISEMIIFDIATLSIRGNLKYLLNNSPTRIVLVWALPDYTRLMIQNALDHDVIGPQFIWILSSTVSLKNFDQKFYTKFSGMLIFEPVVGNIVNAPINKTLLNDAYHIWQEYESETFPGSENVDYYALLAFDATWTFIQALQQFCSTIIDKSISCISFTNTSFCFNRQFLNSKSFFDIIDNNTFLGVSGYVQYSKNQVDRINGTYYIAKNIQYISNDLNIIPILVWSESNGWISHSQTNMIVWPGNSLIIPSGYASISGVNIRIAVIQSPPFTMTKEVTDNYGQKTTKLVGYIPDLIELLEKQMGFNSNIILVPYNLTYNGLIDAVANGIYDIVVADVTITAKRIGKVDFSSSIFDNSLRVIIREETIPDIDLLSYLRPFSYKLWLTLLFASIYSGFLICLLEREHNEALRVKSIISLLVMSMWYSLGTLLGYGVDFHVRTAAGRLLTVGLYILSLVSIAVYTAKLASDLTISRANSVISGIDDIRNGKIPYSRIGIITNTSVEEYYLREISGGIRNFFPLNSEDEMYNGLLNNIIDASIMDSGVIEYSTGNIYCNLTLVGTDFDKNAFGIVYQKNWLYQQYFDVNILSLRESGQLDELKRKWFQTNFCSKSISTFSSMNIESMVGLFLTFTIISILSILLFAWKQRFIIKDYFLNLIHKKNVQFNKIF